MKIDLIYQDSSSNKFWSIEVNMNEHTVTYGRVGTDGTSKTKSFADEETALKEALKLAGAKKRKGYKEVSEKKKVVRDPHTFAGKPIKEFTSKIRLETAIKLFAESYDAEVPIVDKIDKLVKLPEAGQVDTIVIGSWEDAYDIDVEFILNKLIEHKDKLTGLKHLFVADMTYEECEISWILQANYSNFYQHFPNLESFGVRGGQDLTLGELKLPNLKNLVIESGGISKQVITDLCSSNLPNLEYLEIWLGTEDYGCSVEVEDLMPILNGKFPNLKFLGLKNYYKADEFAVALKDAPILNSINILDISMGVTKDAGAKALYENDALLKLDHINCRHHFMSTEWMNKLKEKFANQNINLAGQEKADDDWYYVEIGE